MDPKTSNFVTFVGTWIAFLERNFKNIGRRRVGCCHFNMKNITSVSFLATSQSNWLKNGQHMSLSIYSYTVQSVTHTNFIFIALTLNWQRWPWDIANLGDRYYDFFHYFVCTQFTSLSPLISFLFFLLLSLFFLRYILLPPPLPFPSSLLLLVLAVRHRYLYRFRLSKFE